MIIRTSFRMSARVLPENSSKTLQTHTKATIKVLLQTTLLQTIITMELSSSPTSRVVKAPATNPKTTTTMAAVPTPTQHRTWSHTTRTRATRRWASCKQSNGSSSCARCPRTSTVSTVARTAPSIPASPMASLFALTANLRTEVSPPSTPKSRVLKWIPGKLQRSNLCGMAETTNLRNSSTGMAWCLKVSTPATAPKPVTITEDGC